MKVISLPPPTPVMELLDFEKLLPEEIEVRELENGYFTASLPHGEIKDGRFLESCTGLGATVVEALIDFASRIEGKCLVFLMDKRTEITVPKLTHTKFYNYG